MAGRRQALRNDPQLQRYVIPNVQSTGRQLGVGSYGSVEEVEINGLICAGKRIHETLIEAGNFGVQNIVGVQRIVRKYVEECQMMSDVRHPHIVQFMGVCFLPDSSLPVLVMERLLMSLGDLLENTPDIPLSLKRSMLADVTKGLVYLHNRSSPIIHRDLSARNVLLNSAMTAKISDLGSSRIVDLQPGQLVKTLSHTPGTLVYMPPEALYSLPGYEADKSHYGTKIDIFSYGHLSLFTITQDFPGDLLPPNYPDPNSRGRLIALTEVERRGRYIEQLHRQLGKRHPIVELIEQCLDNDPEYRPSSEDVLQRLEKVKGLIRDPYQDLTRVEMMKLLERKDREIQSQGQGGQAMEALKSQLQQVQLEKSGSERAPRAELEVKGDQLSRLQVETDTMRRDLRALQSDIATKDRQLQEKNRQLQEKDRQLTTVQAHFQANQPRVYKRDDKLDCKQCASLPPHGMCDATAILLDNTVYMGGGTTSAAVKRDDFILKYEIEEEKWGVLPRCSVTRFGLAKLAGKIVVVGGINTKLDKNTSQVDDISSKCFTLDSHEWKSLGTPMPTPRFSLTAMGYQSYLVTCGGVTTKGVVDVVEVCQYHHGDCGEWFVTHPLPLPCFNMSYTIIQGMCYLLGGKTHQRGGIGGITKVFHASLASLIEASMPSLSQYKFECTSHWHAIQEDIPNSRAAAASLGNSLLAVGGISSKPKVNCYRQKERWFALADLPHPNSYIGSAIAELPSGEVLIISGAVEREEPPARTICMLSY